MQNYCVLTYLNYFYPVSLQAIPIRGIQHKKLLGMVSRVLRETGFAHSIFPKITTF